MATAEEETQPVVRTTEDEVKMLTVHQNRNLFTLLVTRPLSDLGKKKTLVDRDSHLGTEGLVEFRSFSDPNYELKLATMNVCIQCAEPTRDTSTQSSWCRKVNSSSQTSPVTYLDEVKQSIIESDSFLEFCTKVKERVPPILDANVSSDVFSDQIANLKASDDSLVKSFSVSQLKEYLSLKDARFGNPVQCIDWQPGSHDTVAISFNSAVSFGVGFKRKCRGLPEHIFVWNFQSILHPKYVLESPSVVMSFKFCPHNPNIIVGGCLSGQVVMWDVSDESTKINAELRNSYSTEDSFSEFYHPKFASSLFGANGQPAKCHYEPVCCLQWLPLGSKMTRIGELEQCENTTQFATISLDGHVIIWDVNIDTSQIHPSNEPLLPGASLKNEWLPTFIMSLLQDPKEKVFSPGLIFSFLTDAQGFLDGNCRFISEYGHAFSFNWTAGPDRSLVGRQNPHLSDHHQLLYHTPVGFANSPFITGLFVCCDRTNVVLADMTNGTMELFRSSARSHSITSVCFSPTRPSVFVVGTENGDIEVWTLLDKSHECMFSQSVASSKVSSLYFGTAKGGKQLLCVGCGDGTLMIYKVPAFMSQPTPNEAELMQSFVEQQIKFVTQTKQRFVARGSNKQQSETESKEKEEKADTNVDRPEEEDGNEKVDTELSYFEKEYAKIEKDFESFTREQEENER